MGKEGGKSKAVQLLFPDKTVFKSFKSFTDCAKFLGLTRPTVSRKLKNREAVLFENKMYTLEIVEDTVQEND